VVGFKPSYGRVSRWGVIAYANSLDTVGILARSSQDAKDIFGTEFYCWQQFHTINTLLEIIDHGDSKDPTNLSAAIRSNLKYSRRLHKAGRDSRTQTENPLKLRIGVPVEYNIEELDPRVRAAWLNTLERLRDLGHSIQPVSLPTTRHALSAYYILAPAEASSNLAKYDGVRYGSRSPLPDCDSSSVLFAKTRGTGFGEEVKRRILLGAYSLSAEAIDNYFIQAQKIRRLVQNDFNSVFRKANPLLTDNTRQDQGNISGIQDEQLDVGQAAEGVDCLVCPTAPGPPPTLEDAQKLDPVHAYMNDVFTVPASLAGLPAMSVPVKLSAVGKEALEHERIGIQVIGQFGDDHLVLDIGELIEQIDKGD
jgi:aspartyl-tRNA(Asn)/glutamyl-tRNA(Gln) amidotransferase subunit A